MDVYERNIKIFKENRELISNGNNAVVLGACGCGAFGEDARIVGRAFAEVLREFKYFDVAYFSVKSTINDAKDNLKLLYSGFESYNG